MKIRSTCNINSVIVNERHWPRSIHFTEKQSYNFAFPSRYFNGTNIIKNLWILYRTYNKIHGNIKNTKNKHFYLVQNLNKIIFNLSVQINVQVLLCRRFHDWK